MTFIKNLYPGGVWSKRLSYMAVVFTVFFNIALNRLQARLYEQGKEMMELAETFAEPAALAAEVAQEEVLPRLRSLEESSLGLRILNSFGIPSSEVLESSLDDIQRFRKMLRTYAPLFQTASFVIRLTSWIYWVAVAWAMLWLVFDLAWGKARLFVSVALVIAVPWNFYAHAWLEKAFVRIAEGDLSLLDDAAELMEIQEAF